MAEGVGEYFLRHDDVARRLGNMDQRELLDAIRAGAFGRDVIRHGRYFFVPMSGFNGFVSARRVSDETERARDGRICGGRDRAPSHSLQPLVLAQFRGRKKRCETC